MVYYTYNFIVNGVYKPTYNWGGGHFVEIAWEACSWDGAWCFTQPHPIYALHSTSLRVCLKMDLDPLMGHHLAKKKHLEGI